MGCHGLYIIIVFVVVVVVIIIIIIIIIITLIRTGLDSNKSVLTYTIRTIRDGKASTSTVHHLCIRLQPSFISPVNSTLGGGQLEGL